MRGLPADDFPELPLVETGTSLKLNSNSLLEALRSTLFASSTDDAKQLLKDVENMVKKAKRRDGELQKY